MCLLQAVMLLAVACMSLLHVVATLEIPLTFAGLSSIC